MTREGKCSGGDAYTGDEHRYGGVVVLGQEGCYFGLCGGYYQDFHSAMIGRIYEKIDERSSSVVGGGG